MTVLEWVKENPKKKYMIFRYIGNSVIPCCSFEPYYDSQILKIDISVQRALLDSNFQYIEEDSQELQYNLYVNSNSK